MTVGAVIQGTEESLAPARKRLHGIDALRGIAIIMMIVYHFAWDLQYLRLVQIHLLTDPWWHRFALFIAGSFIFLTGVGQVLSFRAGFSARRFLKRLAVIAASAGLITLGTLFAVPEGYVFFGILHCIAVSAVLGLPFLWLPAPVTAAAGVFALAAPSLFASEAFAAKWLWWLGLMTFRPSTYDYVPILPWFGWALLGIAATRIAFAVSPRTEVLLAWRPQFHPWHGVEWLGRHSLAVYLLHQPVMFGALWALAWLVR